MLLGLMESQKDATQVAGGSFSPLSDTVGFRLIAPTNIVRATPGGLSSLDKEASFFGAFYWTPACV